MVRYQCTKQYKHVVSYMDLYQTTITYPVKFHKWQTLPLPKTERPSAQICMYINVPEKNTKNFSPRLWHSTRDLWLESRIRSWAVQNKSILKWKWRLYECKFAEVLPLLKISKSFCRNCAKLSLLAGWFSSMMVFFLPSELARIDVI